MFKLVDDFYSIQGEGKYAGTPAYFFRFYGCNLKCDFGGGMVCDESKHSDSNLIYELSRCQMVDKFVNSKAYHVVITGGEPSLQELNKLIVGLQSVGAFVQVETNGHCLANIGAADFITYSPKAGTKLGEGYIGELKLLAGAENPVDVRAWANLPNKYVQPIGFQDGWEARNVAYCVDFVLANPDWKLSLQLHKILEIE